MPFSSDENLPQLLRREAHIAARDARAYEAGRAAAPDAACPHQPDLPEWRYWCAGRAEAARERAQAQRRDAA
jgi:hypothetical protein